MRSTKPTILCTGHAEESLTSLAGKTDAAEIDIVPFIKITTHLAETTERQIKEALTKKVVVVFTSNNAVKTVARYIQQQPDWIIFCMSNTTQKLVKEYFGEDKIKYTADDAAVLANQIIHTPGIKEVIFFCGNLRRNELPDALEQQGIRITEIVVYQTILTPVTIDKKYEAILFFSPSAVESFFSKNKIPASTILFTIGKTTVEALKKYSTNKIITGDEPDKVKLVKKAIRFFQDNTIHN